MKKIELLKNIDFELINKNQKEQLQQLNNFKTQIDKANDEIVKIQDEFKKIPTAVSASELKELLKKLNDLELKFNNIIGE